MNLKVICNKCGYEPKKNIEKSNENWSVYDNKCPKCDGKVEVKVV
ncbi:hypothetical protein [Clostridium botulinum]|nr:hypothetical protein [Clostridium botulinum]